MLDLVHFPNFEVQKQSCEDILQNFTFLQLRELEHKFVRFTEINLTRLLEFEEASPLLSEFLQDSLRHSKKKISRLTRNVISEICKALSTYSGFLLKYDQVIKTGIENINSILVSEIGNIREIIDQFLSLNFSTYKLPHL
jgi:hypothetical protein